MDISFLENGNYQFKRNETDKNLRALIKAMGLKDSDENMKIFRTYLGFEGSRKPLENETFKDYYKRNLKLFMADMQKEAKRKLEQEGKKPVLDGKDIMHKFDNLMHSIGEIHNYEIAKNELAKNPEKAKEGVKESSAKKGASPKKAAATGKGGNPVPVPTEQPKKSEALTAAGVPVSDMQQNGYVQGQDYYWSKFIDIDPNEKDPVEEYMRRQRTFGRFVVEHYTNYDNNLISTFFKKTFRSETTATPTGYYDFDPQLMNEIHKREMFDLMEVTLDEKGKVSNFTQFKDSCKKVAHYFLQNVIPNRFYAHTKEEITTALEEADKIAMVKAPNDTKLHHHLGMSDSSYEELKNQMVFENAFYSLKWIYGGVYDKPLETIHVKKTDIGEDKSKAYLAINLLKGMKEIYDARSGLSKYRHSDEAKQIDEFKKFLVEKAGLSENFIENELKDPELKEKMRAKVEAEAVLKASEDAEKEINKLNLPINKEEIAKETDVSLNNGPKPSKEKVAVKNQNKKIQDPMLSNQELKKNS